MFVWVLAARAAEPIIDGAPVLDVPEPDATVLVPWSDVGFAPAAPESAAFGPDHVAGGPNGRWAIWDPVLRVVRTDAGEMALDHVDDLAFAADGDLLVLNMTSRTLSRWEGDVLVDAVAVGGLCPSQVRLDVSGDAVGGADVFGNVHPIGDLSGGRLESASGRLRAPEHRVQLNAGTVLVDGAAVGVEGAVAARVLGRWVVVEQGARGTVAERVAVSLDSGRVVTLGSRAGHRYRLSDDVDVASDGALTWLSPDADGLRIHRVTP